MSECRRGNRVRADGVVKKNALVEVGVEIGMIINVEANCKGKSFNMEDVHEQTHDKVIDLFQIDGRDKVLNNVCIYSVQ